MRKYTFFRCIMGIIGSVFAFIIGIIFIVEGIKDANSKGILIGGGAILGGIIGVLICVLLLRSNNKGN